MAGSVYDKRSHRNLRARLDKDVQAGHAYCMEIVCIDPVGRWIRPGTRWHLAHHRASGTYLGPAHHACNEAEALCHRHRSEAPQTRTWRSKTWGGTPSRARSSAPDD